MVTGTCTCLFQFKNRDFKHRQRDQPLPDTSWNLHNVVFLKVVKHYRLGLSTVSKLVRFFFGLGLMLYVFKLFLIHSPNPQKSLCVARSNPASVHINFFSLSNWRDLHFHEHFQLEISLKCAIKAETSSTLCKFHEGRKGLRPMGSNADHERDDDDELRRERTGSRTSFTAEKFEN